MKQVAADANPPVEEIKAVGAAVSGVHPALTDDLLAGRFFSIDVRGQVTGWNPRAESAFGWSAHHVSSRSLFDKLVVPGPGFEATDLEQFFDASGGGAGRRVRALMSHQGGTQIPVELSIVPIQLAKAYELNAFLQDVSTSTASGVASEIGRIREEHAGVLNMISSSLEQESGAGGEEIRLAGALIVFHIDAGADGPATPPSSGGAAADAVPPAVTSIGLADTEIARAEAERVRAQIDEALAAAEQARADADQARRERDELQAQLESGAAEVAGSDQMLETARREVEDLRAQAEQAAARAAEAEAAVEQSRSDLDEARSDAERLRGELSALRSTADGTEASAAAAAAELGDARAGLEQARVELERLAAELSGAQAALVEAREERDALTAEVADLRSRIEVAGEVEAALAEAREQVAALDQELTSARADEQAAQDDSAAARAELDQARKRAEEAERRAEEVAADADAARQGGEAAEAAVAGAREEANAARAELAAARERAEATEAELAAARAQVDALGTELEAAREAAESASAELEAAREDASAARAEVETFREAAESWHADIEAAREDVNAARAEVETFREAAESARADVDAAREEANAAREQAESAQTQLESIREEADAARAEATAARDEAEAARTDFADARTEADTARAELEAAREEASAAKADVESAREDAAAAKAAAEAANAARADAEAEWSDAAAEVESLRADLEAARAGDAEVAARAEALNADLKAARDEAKAAGERADAAAAELESLQADLATAREEIDALRAEVEAAQSDATAARSEAETAGATAIFERVFDSAAIGMAIKVDGRFTRVNRVLCELTGRDADALIAIDPVDLVHPDEREAHAATEKSLIAGEATSSNAEARLVHADGTDVHVRESASLLDDGSILLQFEPAAAEAHTAVEDHDPITGLFNRRRFEEELSRHVAEAAKNGDRGAALLLDLDANYDELDREQGEELLKTVAEALKQNIDESEMLAHLGGDEFAVLLPHADAARARKIAEHIVEAVGPQVVKVGDQSVRVTIDVGVALFDEREEPAPATARPGDAETDTANLPVPAADAKAGTALAPADGIVDRLRKALAEDSFQLFAQPIIDLRTSEVTQYELLLRMNDDSGRLMLPDKFLPAAQHAGLMQAIDQWVVRRAIGLIHAAALDGRRLMLEVNISSDSLDNPALTATIESELDATGIDPRLLVIEVTEDAALEKIESAIKLSKKLRAMGCRFAIDDFGSTFATVKYLKDMAVDYFKLDGDLIVTLPESRTNQLLLNALMDVARGTGTQTIAVYVPDDETLVMLRQYGIGYGQGNRVGRPRPVGEI